MPELGGRLDADLRGAGGLSLDALRLTGRVATTPIEYADWQTGELALDVGWDGGAARAVGGGPGVSVLAELAAAGHLTAQANFTDTLLWGIDGAVVALGGTLRWDGPLDDLAAAQADLAFDSLLLRQGEWVLQNYGPPPSQLWRRAHGPHGATPANASWPSGPFGLGRKGFALRCSGVTLP